MGAGSGSRYCPPTAPVYDGRRPPLKYTATGIRRKPPGPAPPASGTAQRHLETNVARHLLGLGIAVLGREADPDHVFVGADFGEDPLARIDPDPQQLEQLACQHLLVAALFGHRSEERRVGKEGVSTCRSRGSP